MGTGCDRYEKHSERMRILKNGGKLGCPYCGKGYISRVSDDVYQCDRCGKGIIPRFPIDLPA